MRRSPPSLLIAVAFVGATIHPCYGFDAAKDLFVEGDLHAAWEAKPFEKSDEFLSGVPEPKHKNHLQMVRADKPRGQMLALVYETPKAAAAAYDELIREVGGLAKSKPADGLGDQSRCFTHVIPGSSFPKSADIVLGSVLFLRANTVVFIKLSGMNADEAVMLAKKVDGRIKQ